MSYSNKEEERKGTIVMNYCASQNKLKHLIKLSKDKELIEAMKDYEKCESEFLSLQLENASKKID